MNILMVTHYFDDHLGGIELVAAQLAARLSGRGHQVTWMAAGPEETIRHGVRRLGVRAFDPTERWLGFPMPIWDAAGMLTLWRQIRKTDIVHVHDTLYPATILACLMAIAAGKAFVVTQHVGAVPFKSRALALVHRAANRLIAVPLLARSARAVFVGEGVRRYFARFARVAARSLLVPNGVDTTLFVTAQSAAPHAMRQQLGWPAGEKIALFVGRFVEKKGLSLVRELAHRLGDWRFVMIGQGPIDPTQWGLEHLQVVPPMPQHSLPVYYRAADVLVLPSVGEGFPLVIQEALACGLPVFTSQETAQGSPLPLCGLIGLELKLSPWHHALTEHAQRTDLLDLRQRVAAEAQSTWDWGSCTSRYEQIYQTAIATVRD